MNLNNIIEDELSTFFQIQGKVSPWKWLPKSMSNQSFVYSAPDITNERNVSPLWGPLLGFLLCLAAMVYCFFICRRIVEVIYDSTTTYVGVDTISGEIA